MWETPLANFSQQNSPLQLTLPLPLDTLLAVQFLENNPPLPDLSSDPGKNPFHPDNLQASIPATLPGLAEKVLPLSGGSILVVTLLTFKTDTDLRNEAGTRHMRTSGNIWENWKGPNQ